MDWIAPIVSASTDFLAGLVTNIGTTFSGLFINTALPSDLALFVLSMIGIVVGYKVLRFTYGIVASLLHRDARG